jgi:hypothetical protein
MAKTTTTTATTVPKKPAPKKPDTTKAVNDIKSSATTKPTIKTSTPPVGAGFNPEQAAKGLPQQTGNVLTHDVALITGTDTYDADAIGRRNPGGPGDQYGFGPGTGGPGRSSYGPNFPGAVAVPPGQRSVASVVKAERAKLYSMSRNDLITFQKRLADAGFYGDADAEGHFRYTPGVRDNGTVDAYNTWLVYGAREWEANKTNADDMLDRMIAEHAASGDLYGAKRDKAKPSDRAGGTSLQRVNLTDPHEISRIGDVVGQAVLGRKLTVAEKESLLRMVHTRQQGAATIERDASNAAAARDAAAQAAVDERNRTDTATGAVEPNRTVAVQTTGTDPEGLINDELRRMHPEEAAGEDLSGALGQALGFLGRETALT